MFCFVLTSVAPHLANDLAVRAYIYSLHRVICGHHWKSDIDAGKELAAVIFSAISGTEAYQIQLKKAQEEYKRIMSEKEVASVRSLSKRSQEIRNYYDLLGRRLESLPDKGLYIHNGKIRIK